MELGPLSPGDDLPLDAEFYNLLREMARDYLATKRGNSGGGGIPRVANHGDPVSVLFQNRTGAALDQYAIVGISDALVPYATSATEFKSRPQFRATAPSATTPFAVLQQPLANYVSDSTPNTIGRAIISGCTVCKINVGDSSHTYAAPTTSTTELTSQATAGPARILAKQSGTGAGKWGVVLLDNSGSSVSSTYDGWCLTADYTTTVTNSGSSYEITGWARQGVGGGSTRVRFPSTGRWLCSLTITGDILIATNGGTGPREGSLTCEVVPYNGNTFVYPQTSDTAGIVAAAYAVNGAGDYKGGGSLTLTFVVDVITGTTTDALQVVVYNYHPGTGSPTCTINVYYTLPSISGSRSTTLTMQKIA